MKRTMLLMYCLLESGLLVASDGVGQGKAITESMAAAKEVGLAQGYQANMELITKNILRGCILPHDIAPSGETLLQSIVKTKSLLLVKQVGEIIDLKTTIQCAQRSVPLTEAKKIAERLLWVNARGADGVDAAQTAVNAQDREIVNELVTHWMRPLIKDTAGVACVYSGAPSPIVPLAHEPALAERKALVKESDPLNNLLAVCGILLQHIGFPVQALTEEAVISVFKMVNIDEKNEHMQKIIRFMTRIDYSREARLARAEQCGQSLKSEKEMRWGIMWLVRHCFLRYIKEKIEDGMIADTVIDYVENVVDQYHCLALYEYRKNRNRFLVRCKFSLPLDESFEEVLSLQFIRIRRYVYDMQDDLEYRIYTRQLHLIQPLLLTHMNKECSCCTAGVECGLRAEMEKFGSQSFNF